MVKYFQEKQMQIHLTSLYLNIRFQFNKYIQGIVQNIEISLADRTHAAAVISHQVLDVLCHLCGEKKHLLYQQIPKFSSSLIDMCKGYDHQKKSIPKKIVINN